MTNDDLLQLLEKESTRPSEQTEHAQEILKSLSEAMDATAKAKAEGLSPFIIDAVTQGLDQQQSDFLRLLKNEFTESSDLRVTAAHLANQQLSNARETQEVRLELIKQQERVVALTAYASRESNANLELAEESALLKHVNADLNQEMQKLREENQTLKSQNEQLSARVKQLEAELRKRR